MHLDLNVEGEMFVLSVGKDFKHQCDWKSTDTNTPPSESVPVN